MKNYYWSFEIDSEIWMGPEESIEDCIEDAKLRDVKDFKSVFIGELEEHAPYIDTEMVIENLQELAYEECGECSEGYLENVTEEQEENLREKLNDALQEWLKETNNYPSFGIIINTKEYDIETGEFKEKDISDKAALWPK